MKKLLLGIALLASSSSLFATTLPISTWETSSFGVTGSTVSGSPYTFTSAGPTVFTITDLQFPGDTFTVFDNGTLLGTTNTVAIVAGNDGICVSADTCLTDPAYSHGVFDLAAGANSIVITVANSPFGFGDVSFRVDPAAPTPEPSTLLLLGTGVLGAARVVKSRVTA